jgi:hypothetical protein
VNAVPALAPGDAVAAWKRWLPEALYLAATSAIGFFAGGRWLSPDGDIGAWWSLTHRIAAGARLYRDVYPELYGPLSPHLLAWAERAFGASATEFLLVNWISGVLAGGMLLYASRPLLSVLERCALAGLIIATSVLAPGSGRLVYCYAPGAVHALFFSILALTFVGRAAPARARDALLGGICAGLAFCCKQEIGAAAAVALWATLAVAKSGRLRWASVTAAGFAAGVLPAVGFALSSASVASLRADSHVWPLVLRPRGDWIPAYRRIGGFGAAEWPVVIRSSMWSLLAIVVVVVAACAILEAGKRPVRWRPILVAAALLGAWWLVDPARLGVGASPIALSSAAAGVVLLAALLFPVEQRARVVAFAAFALIVSLRTVVATDAGAHYAGVAHLATAMTWVILLCHLAPRAFLGAGNASAAARSAFGAGLVLVGWSAAIPAGMALSTTANEAYASPRGVVYVRNPAFFAALGKALRPGDRVLALPEPYALEPIFGVRAWSKRLLFLPPYLAEFEPQLVADLDRDPPEAVVVFDRPTPEYGTAPFGQGYGLATSERLERRFGTPRRLAGGSIWSVRDPAGRASSSGESSPYNPPP